MPEKELPVGIYRHYKGGFYQLIGVARHSETDELMAVYVSLTGAHLPGPRMSVRPLSGPEGFTTRATGAGGLVQRFEYVGLQIPQESTGQGRYK